jgi:hypothetical protein
VLQQPADALLANDFSGRAEPARKQYDGDGVSITTDDNSDGVPDRPAAGLLRAKSTAEYDEQGRARSA